METRTTRPTKKKKRINLPISLLVILLVIFGVLQVAHAHKVHSLNQTIQTAQAATTKQKAENQKLQTEVSELQEEIKAPIKAYGNKTRATLKQAKLNDHLILQTDERWANQKYGWGQFSTVDKNACAIASLSMINAYWDDSKELSVNEVLKWAGNDYFTDYGTSWNIFPAFAQKYGYTYKDLGSNLSAALPYLKKGIPVVASVHPGLFTTVGHILVLSHADDKGIQVLDPNDNALKKHSLTPFPNDTIQEELSHLWVFEKTKK